jgi:hypothetical protein
MCFGLPIILGSDGVNGSHVQLLKAFLEAGMTHHPSIPPTKNLDSQLDVWGSYPVVFDSQPSPRPGERRVA